MIYQNIFGGKVGTKILSLLKTLNYHDGKIEYPTKKEFPIFIKYLQEELEEETGYTYTKCSIIKHNKPIFTGTDTLRFGKTSG